MLAGVLAIVFAFAADEMPFAHNHALTCPTTAIHGGYSADTFVRTTAVAHGHDHSDCPACQWAVNSYQKGSSNPRIIFCTVPIYDIDRHSDMLCSELFAYRPQPRAPPSCIS